MSGADTEQFVILDNVLEAMLDAGEDPDSLAEHVQDIINDWVTVRAEEEGL